jgi:hypothetical protein
LRLSCADGARWLGLRDVYADGLGRKVVVIVAEAVESGRGASGNERAGF